METANGVKIAGAPNMAGRMSADASAVYACNLIAFATLLVKDGELKPIWNIEILKTALVHPRRRDCASRPASLISTPR